MQVLDLNFDFSLDTLYFYRTSMESVIKIIQLWLDFWKEAKHGFHEFSWWKVFLFARSWRPDMFTIQKITK